MGIAKNLFITGTPGIGKTTFIKECVLPFYDQVGGFYTEEIKEDDKRLGFMIKTFDGQAGVFAKKGMKGTARFNKYGVDLGVLESIGIASVEAGLREKKLVIIDEVGTMEMLSKKLHAVLAQALIAPTYLLATIRLKAEPFSSQVKKMSNTEILVLNRDNYMEIKQRVRHWMEEVVGL